MRDIGASEREIEGFKDDIKNADHDTLLAKAINWGAPVNFLKDGHPWVVGDWRRLTLWQRIKRRISLLEAATCIPTERSNWRRKPELSGLSGSSPKCLNLFLDFFVP